MAEEFIDSIPTCQQLFSKCVSSRKPGIIRNFGNSLKCFENWKKNEYLKSKAGDSIVHVEKRESQNHAFGKGKSSLTTMKFKEFLDIIKLNDGNGWEYYLTSQDPEGEELENEQDEMIRRLSASPMDKLLEDLAKDEILPPPCLENLVLSSVNMWMGKSSKWTTSGLHHDFHDNFYFLIKGKKKFNLFSFKESDKMQTRGKIARVHENGRIEYLNESGKISFPVRSDGAPQGFADQEDIEIELAEAETARERGDANAEKLIQELDEKLENIMDSLLDESEYDENGQEVDPPSFCKISSSTAALMYGAKRTIVELNAGDALYLPAGWFHEVESISMEKASVSERDEENENGHLAVNFWFHPPDNLVAKEFKNPYKSGYWRRHCADAYISKLNEKVRVNRKRKKTDNS
jgi:hypothetical protein